MRPLVRIFMFACRCDDQRRDVQERRGSGTLLVSFLYCRRVIKHWSYHAALNIPGCQITASSSGPVWVISSHQRLSHRKRVRRASPALSNAGLTMAAAAGACRRCDFDRYAQVQAGFGTGEPPGG